MAFDSCCRGMRQWSYGDLVFIVDPYHLVDSWRRGVSVGVQERKSLKFIWAGIAAITHVSDRRESAQQ